MYVDVEAVAGADGPGVVLNLGESGPILDFIIAYKRGHDGLSPTYDEIGRACFLGKTTVKHHVDKLVMLGVLARPARRNGLMVRGGGGG